MEVDVYVYRITWFSASDETWNLYQGSRSSTATVDDGYLGAFDVELWNTGGVGVVDRELLDPEEVISIWECGWNGVCVCFY